MSLTSVWNRGYSLVVNYGHDKLKENEIMCGEVREERRDESTRSQTISLSSSSCLWWINITRRHCQSHGFSHNSTIICRIYYRKGKGLESKKNHEPVLIRDRGTSGCPGVGPGVNATLLVVLWYRWSCVDVWTRSGEGVVCFVRKRSNVVPPVRFPETSISRIYSHGTLK